MKPVKQEELVGALNKFKTYFNKNTQLPDLSKIMENLKDPGSTYKKIFDPLRRTYQSCRNRKRSIFLYGGKNKFLRTKDNHSYHIEYNLDKLEGILDPAKFFRINRQFIINYEAIDQMFSFSKSRVKINLKPPINLDTIVSTERSPLFKEWLSGKE